MPPPKLPVYDPGQFESLMARHETLQPDEVEKWIEDADKLVADADMFREKLVDYEAELGRYEMDVEDRLAARPWWSKVLGGGDDERPEIARLQALTNEQLLALEKLIGHVGAVRGEVWTGGQ